LIYALKKIFEIYLVIYNVIIINHDII